MAKPKRNGLGKGLDALFIDNNTEDGAVTSLKLADIEPNPDQPRTGFDEESLNELVDSIRVHGIIQPLVVRPLDTGGYQIVAGERRWRAARRAGLSEVPVVIRDLDEEQTLEIAIIENLQREDLNLVELALGYQSLMKLHNMTQEQVAAKVGKSRSVVANTVRLLALPHVVLEEVAAGNISQGHAKALLALEDEALIKELARRIVKDGILVRDIEKLARQLKNQKENGTKAKESKQNTWGDPYFKEIELSLTQELGRTIKVKPGEKKSVIEVEFFDREDLVRLSSLLAQFDSAKISTSEETE